MKNMSKLMKEAHKLTREIKVEFPNVDYKTQLGICISYLLNKGEENKMVELQGSEKQVKWGEDIRKDFLKLLNNYKERVNIRNVRELIQTDKKEIVKYYGMEYLKNKKKNYEFYMEFLNDLENELKNNINDSKFYINNRFDFGFDIVKFIVTEVRK